MENAARLFRERGIDGASVNDVMKEAGLTHGGFYRHFANKNALVESALEAAFSQITAPLEGEPSDRPADVAGDRFRNFYLSDGHLKNPGIGCPVAALGSEVARGPETVRSRFTTGVRAMLSALARTKDCDDAAAARQLAMMVGAMVIARASEPEMANLMLQASREVVD